MKKGSRVGQELKGIGSSKDLEVVTHGDSLTTCRWKAPKTSDCGSADWVFLEKPGMGQNGHGAKK